MGFENQTTSLDDKEILYSNIALHPNKMTWRFVFNWNLNQSLVQLVVTVAWKPTTGQRP